MSWTVGNPRILGPLRRVDASRVYASSDQKKFQVFRILSRWNFTTGSTAWSFCKIEQVPLEQFLVFSHAVMIVNLFESFCCHLKCLSLIMALFLYNPWNNVLKSPNRCSRDADLQKFNFGFIWRCGPFTYRPIEVPYQVLTTGEDACLRFWDLRLAALPMEGPVSPESYPTGTENGVYHDL